MECIETSNWKTGEALRRANPKTFAMPPKKLRNNLRPGDLVKLIFSWKKRPAGNHFGGERMWVCITWVNPKKKGDYSGRLDNVPCDLPIKVLSKVRFTAANIIDFTHKEDLPHDT